MQKVISIVNGITGHPEKRMAEPVSLEILAGEQVAIVGPNGAGKSRLTDIITGRYPLIGEGVRYDFSPSPSSAASDNIRRITFRDAYGDADQTYYLQLRWNQHDIDPETPTVGQLLDAAWQAAERSAALSLTPSQQQQFRERRSKLRDKLYALFDICALAPKYVISISSGELRKFQLTKMLLSAPRVIVLDNPFVGLDAATRLQLRQLLQTLICETDLQVILELSRNDEIPDFITHIIPVEPGLHVRPKLTREAYLASAALSQTSDTAPSTTCTKNGSIQAGTNAGHVTPNATPGAADVNVAAAAVLSIPAKDLSATPFYQPGCEIAAFNDVTISYAGHTILSHVSWTIHEGERWSLTGPNGSGKSTLLSLICADNPQGYACDTRLFGHRRGSGESIWEIKRHISYVSPEMHRAYLHDLPAEDIVASGLRDSVGLYARPRPEERQTCLTWMTIFGIGHLAQRTFLSLSSGEQRLCLLARAFVKDPELLILDEPLHGLDTANRHLVRTVINAFCQRPHKTLIMVTHYPEELPSCIMPGCSKQLSRPQQDYKQETNTINRQ